MKNIKEITDIFKQEIKKKYTSQIAMPVYMGVSDMEIILEEIERLKEDNEYLNKVNIELSTEKNRLNNIIKTLEKYVIGEQISEYGDTLEEAKEYLEKLKRS